MNKTKEPPIWKWELLAFVIAIALTIPISIVLTSQGIKYTHDRENEHLELRMNTFKDIVKTENLAITTAEEWFDRNLSANVLLMTDTLKTFVANGAYNGPRVFSDGFVVKFQGDSAILPEEMADMDVEISKARVEESLASAPCGRCASR